METMKNRQLDDGSGDREEEESLLLLFLAFASYVFMSLSSLDKKGNVIKIA